MPFPSQHELQKDMRLISLLDAHLVCASFIKVSSSVVFVSITVSCPFVSGKVFENVEAKDGKRQKGQKLTKKNYRIVAIVRFVL